ncbi:MAG: hypothetical protein ABSD58_09235 [Verrucomicrobiia bacterium]|jgi:hypothetical protein
MNVEEFVAETLTQIANGVFKAKQPVNTAGGTVNPGNIARGDIRMVDHNGMPVDVISFDIAVAVSEEKQSSGKMGLSVMTVGAGIQGQSTSSSSSVSRIKFSVPLRLPAF